MHRSLLAAFTVIALSTASVHGAEPGGKDPGSASATAGVSRRVAKAPAIASLSEGEAREWLARYETAWAGRDVAALSGLGIIRADQQDEVRRRLAVYERFDVSVSNESISLDGARALMSFDRIDRDETGRQMRHPRQTVLLERAPEGVVSTWRDRTAAK